MKRAIRTLLLLEASVVMGCGTPSDGAGTPGETTQATGMPGGVQFATENASLDEPLHLVARAYVNDQAEVLSLYEPYPGHIVAVGAGRPTGHALLSPAGLLGSQAHTGQGIWQAVAPGQPMPDALLQAMARQAAGVGNERLVSTPNGAEESIASLEGVNATQSAQQGPGEASLTARPGAIAHDTSWCDTVWESDFNPSTMVGSCGRGGFMGTSDPTPDGSNYPCFDSGEGNWYMPFGTQAEPYGDPDADICECTERTVQGYRAIDVSSAGTNANKEWENFATACASNGPATLAVSGSWNASWTLGTNSFMWIEDVGTVTCFTNTCINTNDVPTFNVHASTQFAVSYLAEAYGP
jgi:hypothetical protein